MAINIQNIQFQHVLFDVTNKPAKGIKVQIQFYNVLTKSWLSLTDLLALSTGKLSYKLTIPARISTKNQTIRVVREVIKSGGTPSFRIINATNSGALPEVITTAFDAIVEGDTKLTIDFGKSWLLDPERYITKDDHIVVASQVPMFEFANEIRAIKEANETTMAQVSGLNATIATLTDQRVSLQSQLSTAQNNIQDRTQEVSDLNINLQTVTANLASERTLRQTIETEKSTLETALATQREQMETMQTSNGDVQAIEMERDNAMAQVSGLNDAVASLSNEREMLQMQLSTTQNDFETKEQEVAELSMSLETTRANLTQERTLRETLQTEKSTLETEVAAQREQIETMQVVNVADGNFEVLYNGLQQEVADITLVRDNLQQQVVDITLLKDNLQQQISVVTVERDNLSQEKVAFQATISQLQTSVQQEKALVTAKDIELQQKQSLVTSLQRETESLQEELEEARDFNVTNHPNKLTASKVYSSIVNDVVKADAELVNSRYKLANVSLNLKTTVEKGPEGTIFGLLDYESAKDVNSAAISDISIDIVPTDTSSTTVEQKMPNILGLTETAVRKVLGNNGLKLDAVYHPTNDDKLIEGQSFKQSPAPDTSIVEGQEVIVIFAKPIN